MSQLIAKNLEIASLKRIVKLAKRVREKLEETAQLTQHEIGKIDEISELSHQIKSSYSQKSSQPSEAERLTNEILEVILALATLDFSKTVKVGYEDSGFNAVATGLNMLGQELQRSVVSKAELEKVVIQLTQAEKQLQKAYEHLEQLVQERTKELSETNEALKIEVEERKKAEHDAKSREQKFRNIFESTAVSVWEQDVSEFRVMLEKLRLKNIPIEKQIEEDPSIIAALVKKIKVLAVNKATMRIFETEDDQVFLNNPEKIFTPQSFEVFKLFVIDIFNGNKMITRETEYVTLKGRKILALLQISFINSSGALAHIVDITGQKELEQQLRQSQKMEAVGQLAGGVAHDFNNLLTVILSYGQLILEELPKDDPMMSKISAIVECGEKAAALTRQLLSFSRADVVAPKVLNLNTIVEKMVQMLHRVLGEHVSLKTVLATDCGKIYADQGHIEQIIMNLSVNARDAMPNGGLLTIETANCVLAEQIEGVKPGNYVKLSVSDNGHGMSDEVRAHIFEPFFTTKAVGKGTGLGLSTVYGIAKQNHASVTVQSELGTGTTFSVFFPIQNSAIVKEPDKKEDAVKKTEHMGNETILVVEDENAVRSVSCATLKTRGYKVLEAANAAEAEKIANTPGTNIDLLLSDVIMPGLTGPELANKLQKGDKDLKVLFVSGYTDRAFAKFDRQDKKVNFLAKPFLPNQLAKKVRETIDEN